MLKKNSRKISKAEAGLKILSFTQKRKKVLLNVKELKPKIAQSKQEIALTTIDNFVTISIKDHEMERRL